MPAIKPETRDYLWQRCGIQYSETLSEGEMELLQKFATLNWQEQSPNMSTDDSETCPVLNYVFNENMFICNNWIWNRIQSIRKVDIQRELEHGTEEWLYDLEVFDTGTNYSDPRKSYCTISAKGKLNLDHNGGGKRSGSVKSLELRNKKKINWFCI
jgi:hypothetical protein